jgi:hypothetical protein
MIRISPRRISDPVTRTANKNLFKKTRTNKKKGKSIFLLLSRRLPPLGLPPLGLTPSVAALE